MAIGNIPTMATFDMFDCRVMPNPYWNESLRGYTGCDKPIAEFFDRTLTRSVYFVGRMAERLAGIDGVEVAVVHPVMCPTVNIKYEGKY